jgi:hypothetical protein
MPKTCLLAVDYFTPEQVSGDAYPLGDALQFACVTVINGVFIGAYKRAAAAGSITNNLALGALPVA